MKTVLDIHGLSKNFDKQASLQDLHLTIRDGDIYGLIGKNGAWKTTLIKIITQLLFADKGTVSLFSSQSENEWTKALSRVGSVIESPVAHNHLTAYQNLKYYCMIRHIPNTDQVIRETLDYVGLSDTGKKVFRDFSLGMKQRLGIAIALLSKPDFIILDEPINGLDPIGIKEFRLMIQRLNQEKGITILISSHILSELYLVANRFGILDQGKIIREISKAEFETLSEDYIVLKTSDKERACQVLKEQIQLQFKVVNPENEIHIFGQEQDVKQILKQLTLADVAIDEIYFARQNLEEYFTQLVEEEKNHDTYHSSRFLPSFPLQRILDYRIHSLCPLANGCYYRGYRTSNVSSASTT